VVKERAFVLPCILLLAAARVAYLRFPQALALTSALCFHKIIRSIKSIIPYLFLILQRPAAIRTLETFENCQLLSGASFGPILFVDYLAILLCFAMVESLVVFSRTGQYVNLSRQQYLPGYRSRRSGHHHLHPRALNLLPSQRS